MKKLIIPFIAFMFLACAQTEKSKENPADRYAIDSIAFSTKEKSFDSIKTAFEDKFSNPHWKEDMTGNYPHIYNGWGFDNTKGIFSKGGLLVGVVLSNLCLDKRMAKSDYRSVEILDSIATKEFGKAVDAHQSPSENEVKAKGEYAYKLFQKGNRCALITYSWSNDVLHENYYIYRADKIPQSENGRRIDNDLSELNKLR